MQDFKKSQYTVTVPLADAERGLAGVYNILSRGLIVASEEALMRIFNSSSRSEDEPLIGFLRENALIIPINADENAVFQTWRHQHIHNFSVMRSKVVVTRRCNNRCRYCIVTPEEKDMSHETARGMDRYYFQCIEEARPERVLDEFTGGEPLLNPDVILESAGRRYYYCLGKGIEYGFTFITNGALLSSDLVLPMKEIGLRGVRVSLAGPAEVHNRLRPLAGGGNSYDRIMENLSSVSGLTPITLECQYDAGVDDYHRIPEMLDDLKERGILIKNVCYKPILPRRNGADYGTGTGDPEILLYLMQEAEARGYPQLDEPPMHCCSADFLSRINFDTDGSLIPCPVLQSGEMVYGNVVTGIDFITRAQILPRRLPERCLNACELLPLCLGGCRLQALVRGDTFNGVSCEYESLKLILESYIRAKAAQALNSVREAQPQANAA